jgi:hypothetical protein
LLTRGVCSFKRGEGVGFSWRVRGLCQTKCLRRCRASMSRHSLMSSVRAFCRSLGPIDSNSHASVQSMAPAGFAVQRGPFPLPIPPRYGNGCHHYRCPEGHQQSDHHFGDRDKGFGQKGSPGHVLCADASIGLSPLRLFEPRRRTPKMVKRGLIGSPPTARSARALP